jgi:hypothetical protein
MAAFFHNLSNALFIIVLTSNAISFHVLKTSLNKPQITKRMRNTCPDRLILLYLIALCNMARNTNRDFLLILKRREGGLGGQFREPHTKGTVEVYRTCGSASVRIVKCSSLRSTGSLRQLRRQGKLKKTCEVSGKKEIWKRDRGGDV